MPEHPGGPPPINWERLEEGALEASQGLLLRHAAREDGDPVRSVAVLFDGAAGSLRLAIGTQRSVLHALRLLGAEDAPSARLGTTLVEPQAQYRAAQLSPGLWGIPMVELATESEVAARQLRRYTEHRAAHGPGQARAFLEYRLEYLAHCLAATLRESEAVRVLPDGGQVLVFPVSPSDTLEIIEKRLAHLFPAYRPATAEWAEDPGTGRRRAARCAEAGCGARRGTGGLLRCTYCDAWYCGGHRGQHCHPELAEPQPLFSP
jgi:hypothetical protein